MDVFVTELQDICQSVKPVYIIDVRQELEFHTCNIGGNNIPLGKLAELIDEFGYDKEDEIIVICQHGLRSKTARNLLLALGYKNVRNLAGGLHAWRKLNTGQNVLFKTK